MKKDFFISRAGPDAAWAQWIAKTLEDAGYDVVVQDRDFIPGQDFVINMDRAMRSADRTIALLSRSYDLASFTHVEWAHEFARDPLGHQERLVPVRIDDIQPEGIFSTKSYIDLVGLDEAPAAQRLLAGVQRATARKIGPAPHPGAITARFPGSLPPVWRLPSDRNPIFAGRADELTRLADRFNAPDPPPLIAALVGLDGAGKTALAVEYAYRYHSTYKAVWWVRAERAETAVSDMALLAEQLGVAKQDSSLAERAAAARDWLANHNQWLLILDDAHDHSILRAAIPQGGGGHVIITSNSPAWRRHATVLDIAPLEDEPAADLLARRSGQTADASSVQLVRVLGGLPLAVELAGAFLEQQGIGAHEYLARLSRAGGIPFDDPKYRPPDVTHGFRQVWAQSFQLLQKQHPLATDLLRLAAYLAPDDIPRPALQRGAPRLPTGLGAAATAPDELADLVAHPRAFSLISSGGDGFSIHPLTQAVIRDTLAPADRKSWAGAAVLLLDYVMPKQVTDFRLWSRAGRLVGHALTAADHGVAESVEPLPTIMLLDRGVTFLAETGGDVREVSERRDVALRIADTLPNGPPGWLLNNQADWLARQNLLDQADAMFERAVQAIRRTEGGRSSDLGVTWINVGNIAMRRKQLDRARTALQRGLAILDTLPSRAAAATRANGHSLLGQVLFDQGEKDAAAPHFAAAVRDFDAALGPGSLESINNRSFLAQVRGEDPNIIVTYQLTASTIDAEEGRLLAAEPAWRNDAEQLLRRAVEAGEPGAAVELATLLRADPGRKAEGDAVLSAAADRGDREALYWIASEMGSRRDPGAAAMIRRSIAAGNAYSWYDLGLLLAEHPQGRRDAEQAFRAAIDAGFEEARNDLGLLLLQWPTREPEGEAQLAEGGRRGQARCWFNLAQYRWNQPGRPAEAVAPMRLAADAGYLKAHGTLAYLLQELRRPKEALAAFRAGVEAGDRNLQTHLDKFLKLHPELAG